MKKRLLDYQWSISIIHQGLSEALEVVLTVLLLLFQGVPTGMQSDPPKIFQEYLKADDYKIQSKKSVSPPASRKIKEAQITSQML